MDMIRSWWEPGAALLVVGTARSGTKFAAKRWRLGHERLSPQGCCSWLMGAWMQRGFALDLRMHGEIPTGWSPRGVIHLVRDPLHTIASCTTLALPWRLWASTYISLDVGTPDPEWAIEYWIRWQQMIRATRWPCDRTDAAIVRVEHVYRGDLPPTINSRPHATLTWGRVVDAVGRRRATEVRAMAKELGYE